MRAWRACPGETIVESVREQLETTVEAMKELVKDGNAEEARRLVDQMMQQAITLGYAMDKSRVTKIITDFEERMLKEMFQDGCIWSDDAGDVEVIIRFQMLLGALGLEVGC